MRPMVNDVRRDEVAGPFRLLMRIPVPWVFILAYLIGVGLEHAWPVRLGDVGGRVTLSVGVVLFGAEYDAYQRRVRRWL